MGLRTSPILAEADAGLLELAPYGLVAGFVTRERLADDIGACVQGVQAEADAGITAGGALISGALSGLVTGGKRLRPLLTLATAYATSGSPASGAVRAGVVVELLHLASLVHDDVMDEAAVRHGVPSVNIREGNIRAVVAGDFLVARALGVASELGRDEVSLTADAFARLCVGQAAESATLHDPGRTELDYYEAIEGKTAALLSASCQLGAMTAGTGPETTAALASFGRHLGLAYQLVDDLLDLTGSADRLGKPAGHDLTEGVFTLPVLYAVDERPELKGLLERLHPGSADREQAVRDAVELVKGSSAMQRTRERLDEHTRHALGALSGASADLSPAGLAMLSELVTCLAGRRY